MNGGAVGSWSVVFFYYRPLVASSWLSHASGSLSLEGATGYLSLTNTLRGWRTFVGEDSFIRLSQTASSPRDFCSSLHHYVVLPLCQISLSLRTLSPSLPSFPPLYLCCKPVKVISCLLLIFYQRQTPGCHLPEVLRTLVKWRDKPLDVSSGHSTGVYRHREYYRL